jgi:hypothetical protein
MVERIVKNIRSEVIQSKNIELYNPKDPVADFIQRLANTEMHLSEPVSWTVSHGRRRTIANMKIVREQRESQLKTTQEALRILRGREFTEATFFKNPDGKIVGFKIDSSGQD